MNKAQIPNLLRSMDMENWIVSSMINDIVPFILLSVSETSYETTFIMYMPDRVNRG
jgi:hypothetical protein